MNVDSMRSSDGYSERHDVQIFARDALPLREYQNSPNSKNRMQLSNLAVTTMQNLMSSGRYQYGILSMVVTLLDFRPAGNFSIVTIVN